MPADPQSTALLAHVVAQTKANIDFLVSQNYLLANDASGVLSKLSTLESEADAASNPVLSAAERTRQLALTDGPPGFTGMPTPSRPQSPPKAVMPTRRAVLPPRPSRSPAPRVQRARALWDYNENGTDANDLSFRAGDTVEIVSETNADWWTGRLNGRQGLFPANYVEKLYPSPTSAMSEPPIPVPEPAGRPTSPGRGGSFYGRGPASPPNGFAPSYPPSFGPPGPGPSYGPPAWSPSPGPPQAWGGYEKQQQVAYTPLPGPPIQQAPPPPPQPQPEKKNRFGGLGQTMANSAAGGLGFGAGAAVGGGIIDAIF